MNTPHPLLQGSPYRGYAYAYPHKTAYRPLDPPRPLREVWRDEPRHAVFLYLHVPYCEMRCGFCNLFTTVDGRPEAHDATLQAIGRQIDAVADAVGPITVAQAAVGGGTPTLLQAESLAQVLDRLRRFVDLETVPWSIETSPQTATPDRLAVLAERGVNRISMGVQSFLDDEVRAAGRPQRRAEVDQALAHLRDAAPPELNLDLMYGLPGQTDASFRYSLEVALGWAPEELFLYPLYVRPKTGLDRMGGDWDDLRLALYRSGREVVLQRGYVQKSMRRFRRADAPAAATAYRCQADGMVGLGPGARSYTRGLHYSTEWGVGRARVREIVAHYHRRSAEAHAMAHHGVALEADEQRRRYVLKSVLCDEGLTLTDYATRYGASPFAHLPGLRELVDVGLAEERAGTMYLTERGLERSDAIGAWLISPAMRQRMRGFDLR